VWEINTWANAHHYSKTKTPKPFRHVLHLLPAGYGGIINSKGLSAFVAAGVEKPLKNKLSQA